ncbi:hypothetical protein [Gimesia sp.]|uniref:hypothetical protein n=1 Tax=Gimesia sp. TaxID=2024833 RepID=UPI003A91F01D
MQQEQHLAWLQFESLSREYQALKSEQSARIGFRDNLLYVTLGSLGALLGYSFFSLEQLEVNADRALALLAGPWITIILGWTYCINDRVITQIARYVELNLKQKMQQIEGLDRCAPFEWEILHRTDENRFARKLMQLIIDLFAFPIAGVTFIVLSLSQSYLSLGVMGTTIAVFEVLLLLVLTWHIIANCGLLKKT